MTFNEIGYLLLITIELLILAVAAVYSVLLLYSWLKGAPYVATRDMELKEIFNAIKVKKGAKMVELGCGDGRVLRYASKKYGYSGLGVDVNPLLILQAKLITKFQKIPNLKFKIENISKTGFSEADVIYIYLFPILILSLKEKLLEQTNSGTYIISHAFKIDYLQKKLVKTIKGQKVPTYIYRI